MGGMGVQPNVKAMNLTHQQRAIMTYIRDRDATREDFVFAADR
jgi:hypothetical protein